MTIPKLKRGRGRPKSRPGANRIEAYFSDAEIAAIRTAANRAGVPVSHWLRDVSLKAARRVLGAPN